ncbi:MAG: hypothetical protein IJJ84_01865 [Kiritimatiellae bacterium]|nr:hypothetical protein [Kiritimatiellia bacterium]
MKKVAIVGVEGSGKTVMLAGLGHLYSRPDVNGYFLCPKNFQTAAYVSDKIARMRKGEWPTATADDVMQGLDWTLRRRQLGHLCQVLPFGVSQPLRPAQQVQLLGLRLCCPAGPED